MEPTPASSITSEDDHTAAHKDIITEDITNAELISTCHAPITSLSLAYNAPSEEELQPASTSAEAREPELVQDNAEKRNDINIKTLEDLPRDKNEDITRESTRESTNERGRSRGRARRKYKRNFSSGSDSDSSSASSSEEDTSRERSSERSWSRGRSVSVDNDRAKARPRDRDTRDRRISNVRRERSRDRRKTERSRSWERKRERFRETNREREDLGANRERNRSRDRKRRDRPAKEDFYETDDYAGESNRLFVANCDFRSTAMDVADFFQDCRGFQNFYFLKYGRGGHRGYGFANFDTPADAEAAKIEVHGRRLKGRDIAVRIADPQSEASQSKRQRYSYDSHDSKSTRRRDREKDTKEKNVKEAKEINEIEIIAKTGPTAADTPKENVVMTQENTKVEETSDEREEIKSSREEIKSTQGEQKVDTQQIEKREQSQNNNTTLIEQKKIKENNNSIPKKEIKLPDKETGLLPLPPPIFTPLRPPPSRLPLFNFPFHLSPFPSPRLPFSPIPPPPTLPFQPTSFTPFSPPIYPPPLRLNLNPPPPPPPTPFTQLESNPILDPLQYQYPGLSTSPSLPPPPPAPPLSLFSPPPPPTSRVPPIASPSLSHPSSFHLAVSSPPAPFNKPANSTFLYSPHTPPSPMHIDSPPPPPPLEYSQGFLRSPAYSSMFYNIPPSLQKTHTALSSTISSMAQYPPVQSTESTTIVTSLIPPPIIQPTPSSNLTFLDTTSLNTANTTLTTSPLSSSSNSTLMICDSNIPSTPRTDFSEPQLTPLDIDPPLSTDLPLVSSTPASLSSQVSPSQLPSYSPPPPPPSDISPPTITTTSTQSTSASTLESTLQIDLSYSTLPSSPKSADSKTLPTAPSTPPSLTKPIPVRKPLMPPPPARSRPSTLHTSPPPSLPLSLPPSPPLGSSTHLVDASYPPPPTPSPSSPPSSPELPRFPEPIEEQPSALELRIRRILRAQEERFAAAYNVLEMKINQIRQLIENKSQEEKSAESQTTSTTLVNTNDDVLAELGMANANFEAIESLANYYKTGSLSTGGVVDSSSYRANSALYSSLKILASEQINTIWNGVLSKDGMKICTMQGFALSDTGASPLDLPKNLDINFTSRLGVWKKAYLESTNIIIAPARIQDLRRLQYWIDYLKKKDSAGAIVSTTERIYLFTPDMEFPLLGSMVPPNVYDSMCALFVSIKSGN